MSAAAANAFEVIPAIDLLGGQAVRLAQGSYDDATVYDDRPARVAARFVAAGASRIHVVDLDGAKAGAQANELTVRAVVSAAGRVPVQLGGGLRTRAAIDRALEIHVDRVILGTVALRDPALVREAAAAHPGKIVVGIDAKDGRVAVEGWLEASDVEARDLARAFEDAGVAAIVYTDIARDGMLTGPNLEATVALARAVSIPVIVSGGVASTDDLVAAARHTGDGIAGAIVGRALYTGAIDLEAAIARVRTQAAGGA